MKRIKYIIACFMLSLLMLGGILWLAGDVRASASDVPVMPEMASLGVTEAPTLTLEIPDTPLDLDTGKALDLGTYTHYTGTGTLTYTAMTDPSDYFTATLVGTDTLYITSTSTITGGAFPVDVEVTDGMYMASDSFSVTIASSNITLSLEFPPKLGVAPKSTRIVDLWDFTKYTLDLGHTFKVMDKSRLVYTVTQLTGSYYFDVQLMDTHYMSVATTAMFDGNQADVEVVVSDGIISYTVEVLIVSAYTPLLDFYGDYSNVAPNPLRADAGKLTYLTFDDEYQSAQPLYRFIRSDANTSYFRITNADSLPDALGAEIITDTQNCMYPYCYFLTFRPERGLMGTYQVEVEAWNYAYMSATDTMSVTVWQTAYLPGLIKDYPPTVKLLPIDNPDNDGDYYVQWEIYGAGYSGFEVQYSLNDPNFTNPEIEYENYGSHGAWTPAPGTYYWRVRSYNSEKNFAWSNVQSLYVGNYAYLYVEPLCLYGLRIDLTGPGTFSKEYDTSYCNDVVFWRSVPVGTYTTRMRWVGGSTDYSFSQFLDNKKYIIRAGDLPRSWSEFE